MSELTYPIFSFLKGEINIDRPRSASTIEENCASWQELNIYSEIDKIISNIKLNAVNVLHATEAIHNQMRVWKVAIW